MSMPPSAERPGRRPAALDRLAAGGMSVLLALAAQLSFVTFLPPSTRAATTITVCASGCDHATIQAAIAAASAGDTVLVSAGTYVEDLVIDRAITLAGPNAGVAAGPGPSLPSRSPEAIVMGVTNAGAKVTATGVVVDGMKFVRPTGAAVAADVRALSNGAAGVHTVVRNSIFDLANGASRGCGSAISSTWDRVDLATSFRLEANGFYNQTTAGCTSTYFSRIVYLDSAAAGNEVVDDYFSLASEVFATDTADGLLVEGNYFASGGGAVTLGAIDDAVIRGNTFVNPNGYAIQIDGGTAPTDGNNRTRIEDNRFLAIQSTYYHVYATNLVSGLLVAGNTFVSGGSWAIGLGTLYYNGSAYVVSTAPTSGTIVRNNDFRSGQTRALWNCQASGTLFQRNKVGSPGSSAAGVLQYKPVRNGGSTAQCGTTGGYVLDATADYWGTNATPILTDTNIAPASDYVTVIEPKIAAYTDDPAHCGAGIPPVCGDADDDPGFWPIVTAANVPTATSADAPPQAMPVGDTTVAIDFGAVTGAGTTTVTIPAVGDPGYVAPSGFSLGTNGVYFDISTTATFTPPVAVCIPGASPQRLYHYAGGTWTDVTTGYVAGPPALVCGSVSSLSPFALGEPLPLYVVPGDQSITVGTAAPGSAFYTFTLYADAAHTTEVDPGTLTGYTAPTCGSAYTAASPAGTPITISCGGGSNAGSAGSVTGYVLDYAATATLTVTAASAAVTYTGPTFVMIPSGSTVSATLGATVSPSFCGPITFTVTPIDGGAALTPTATTATTATFTLASGMYDVVAAIDDADCSPSRAFDEAVLAVVSAGDTSTGGGWYRYDPSWPGGGKIFSGSPRINFGYTIQRTTKAIRGSTDLAVTYRGQVLWLNKGQWRLKASIRTSSVVSSSGTWLSGDPLPFGYLATCPTTFTSTLPAGTTGTKCATLTGTGTLEAWDGALDGGLGGWVPSTTYADPVAFAVTVYDGGQVKVCTKKTCSTSDNADWFGIQVDPVPSFAIRESAPVALSGGSIKVR